MNERFARWQARRRENFSYFMASFLLQPTATTRRPSGSNHPATGTKRRGPKVRKEAPPRKEQREQNKQKAEQALWKRTVLSLRHWHSCKHSGWAQPGGEGGKASDGL